MEQIETSAPAKSSAPDTGGLLYALEMVQERHTIPCSKAALIVEKAINELLFLREKGLDILPSHVSGPKSLSSASKDDQLPRYQSLNSHIPFWKAFWRIYMTPSQLSVAEARRQAAATCPANSFPTYSQVMRTVKRVDQTAVKLARCGNSESRDTGLGKPPQN